MNDSALRSNTAVFDHAGLVDGWRSGSWREEVCRNFCWIDAEPADADEMGRKILIVQVSSLALAAVGRASIGFQRTPDLMSYSCDDFVLTTAISGDVVVFQGGRRIVLHPSQMYLMETGTEGGVGLSGRNQFTSIRIPRHELLDLCPLAESRLPKPLLGSPQIRELIIRHFNLSVGAAASLDVAGQRIMARHMVDLIALLIRTGQDETEISFQRESSAAPLQLVQSYILESLGDNGLTIASIAHRAALTPKQVQRLFERAGTTFTGFVLEQRLLLARRLLSGRGVRHDKIGAIAYTAGFGDLSYFNRTFRRRFGMTPSEWRDGQPVCS